MSMSLTLSTIHAHTCPKLPRTSLPGEHDLPTFPDLFLARKPDPQTIRIEKVVLRNRSGMRLFLNIPIAVQELMGG